MSFSIHAQVNLGMSKEIISFPDTVDYGDTAYYTAHVINYGPDIFTGDITVYTAILDTSGLNIIDTDTSLYNTTNLTQNDSLPVILTAFYDSVNYQRGNNVVVIWPSAIGAFTIDSVRDTVYVRDLQTSLKTIVVSKYLKIYPNPVKTAAVIENNSKEIKYKTIRILNSSGRIEKTLTFSEFIDFSHLSQGIYYLELINEKEKTVLKIIKTD